MAFDAAALQKSLQVPEIVLPRTAWWERLLVGFGVVEPTVTIRGRLMSYPEWVPWEAQLNAIFDGTSLLEGDELVAFYAGLCRAIGLPVWRMERLSGSVINAALSDFLARLYIAAGTTPAGPQPPTSTNGSPPGDGSPSSIETGPEESPGATFATAGSPSEPSTPSSSRTTPDSSGVGETERGRREMEPSLTATTSSS